MTVAKSSAAPASNGNGNGNGHSHTLAAPVNVSLLQRAGVMLPTKVAGGRDEQFAQFQLDAPACDNCGAITVRNGNCYLCHNCGNSMGCS